MPQREVESICHLLLQVSLGSVVMVRGLTQSVVAASFSSTYSSTSPRMSSIHESVSDAQHTISGIQQDPSTTTGMMVSLVSLRRLIVANVSLILLFSSVKSNPILLVGALHAEVTEGRKNDVIDDYLHRAQLLCSQSDKEAQRLVTAGIVPTVILLLRARALDASGLETALITLGMLAYA